VILAELRTRDVRLHQVEVPIPITGATEKELDGKNVSWSFVPELLMV
jgi:hypothetical protein